MTKDEFVEEVIKIYNDELEYPDAESAYYAIENVIERYIHEKPQE